MSLKERIKATQTGIANLVNLRGTLHDEHPFLAKADESIAKAKANPSNL